MRAACDALKCETAQRIAARFNVAWATAGIDAIEWPDTQLPLRYILGYPVIFDIADTGVFRSDHQPAEISREQFEASNTRAVTSISNGIERSVRNGDEEAQESRRQCWKRTREEIDAGLVGEPMTRAQTDRKYKRGKWRCLGRSAIFQKKKYRCIDNGKKSKHNKATSLHERLVCGRSDFPVTVSREFARRTAWVRTKRKRRRFSMRHGTGDLFAAYRRVPTSQPEYTVVAVYCYECNPPAVRYCDVPGHNFGLTSAVVNFNGFPELATALARRLLWVVTEHYFDDSNTCEPSSAGDTGQFYLEALCDDAFCGFGFDPKQTEAMDDTNDYLGVTSDLTRFADGVLTQTVAKKRRSKLHALVEQAISSNSLQSGLASSIFGKSRFMLSPQFGCVGKACLQPIMQREYSETRDASLSADLADSLEFLQYACEHLPPMELPLMPASADAVVVFVDAEGKKRKGARPPEGHVGFVVYHPHFGTVHGSAKVPASLTALFDRVRKRETYIGQYELVGAIVPFLSLPREWFAGYSVELWIDNSSAVAALIKGYSGKPDCARIVNMFHFAFAKLGALSLWIDYVNTESNPADTPSRFHEMSQDEITVASADIGPRVFAVIPNFADDDGEWLSFANIARSVWGV
jgi:hypothetical protein